MKTHWLSLWVLAVFVLWTLPEPASAARRNRIQRRAQRVAPQSTAGANTPTTTSRSRTGRTYLVNPRGRRDERRNGGPTTTEAARPTVARSGQNAPRNNVQRNDAAEQLPELREPTLSTGAKPRVDRAVEPADFAAAGDFSAEPPRDARDAKPDWRDRQIEELERRIEALEAALAAPKPRPRPLGD